MPCEYSCHAACYPIYSATCYPCYRVLVLKLPTILYRKVRNKIPHQLTPSTNRTRSKLFFFLVTMCLMTMFVLEDRHRFYIQVYPRPYPWVGAHLNASVTYSPIYQPNCQLLEKGDKLEMKLTERMLYGEETAVMTSSNSDENQCFLYDVVKQQTIEITNSTRRGNMSLAFILYVGLAPLDQFTLLFQSLYETDDIYCIVLHRTITISSKNCVKNLTQSAANIYFSSTHYFTPHEKLTAELECVDLFWNHSKHWTHIINLEDSAYLLKPIEKIRDTISKLETSSIENYHSENVQNIKFYRGSSQLLLTRRFLTYYMQNQKYFQKILLTVKNMSTFGPEYFWTTIYKHRFKTNNITKYHTSKWSQDNYYENMLCTYGNLYVESTNLSSTKLQNTYSKISNCIFTVKDLKLLKNSSFLFANSFDLNIDNVVLQCIYISTIT